MDGTVKVPGVGPVNKKYMTIGAVIGAAGLAYMLIRKHSANAAAAAVPATPADPNATGTDPTGTGTGLDGYGNPYSSGAYDPYASTGQQGVGNGTIIGYDSNGRPVYGSSSTSATTATQTEAQWIAAAASDLATNAGTDYATAAAALTKWVAGQDLTPAQAVLVKEAEALEGPPPNGAPPIHVIPSHTPGPPSGHPGSTLHAPSGLHATDAAGPGSIDVAWGPVPNASRYEVYVSDGTWHGTSAAHATHARISVPHRNKHYTASVAGIGSDGKAGPHSPSITFVTKK